MSVIEEKAVAANGVEGSSSGGGCGDRSNSNGSNRNSNSSSNNNNCPPPSSSSLSLSLQPFATFCASVLLKQPTTTTGSNPHSDPAFALKMLVDSRNAGAVLGTF